MFTYGPHRPSIAQMRMSKMDEQKLRKGYNGYELTTQARNDLFAHINPMYPDIIANHVTHNYGIYDELPPKADSARVIAVVSNEKVQAAIVKINGTTTREYGDSFYHVTISVDRAAGGSPKDSNELLKDSRNWHAVDPFNIEVIPKFFPF